VTTAKIPEPKTTFVIARESNGNIQITFVIPFALIRKAQEEAVIEMAKDIEIPGFRKGTAPASRVREKIPQNSLIEHSLGHILPKALAEVVNTEKLKLAIYPKFELIKSEENEPWQIRAVTCELPEVNLGEYKKFVPGEIRAASLKKELTKEEKEQTIIKSLLMNVKIDIPKILIEEEADSRLSSLLSRLEKLGLALETYLRQVGKKPEDIRAEYATQAKEAIALDLILSSVAEAETLKIDQKEIDEALRIGDIKDVTDERRRLIESILKRRKSLDFLMNLS
jgi:trigger factor